MAMIAQFTIGARKLGLPPEMGIMRRPTSSRDERLSRFDTREAAPIPLCLRHADGTEHETETPGVKALSRRTPRRACGLHNGWPERDRRCFAPGAARWPRWQCWDWRGPAHRLAPAA